MVEGPLVHHTARIHRRLLIGKAFAATSPSGRFTEGASAINGRYVSLIEVHGKNIFYFFTTQKVEKAVLAELPHDVVVVHIHFGMAGTFRTFAFPGPEPRVKTRLRLHNEDENIDAHLTASVCVHGDMEVYRSAIAKLGPDPLRADADKELMWRKMQKTRKTIGSILMDQSVVAGIGNMYRAEILFVSGLHPDQRASILARSAFEKLWEQSEKLLRVGMLTRSNVAVSPEDIGQTYYQEYLQELTSYGSLYVYMQSTCIVCQGAIRKWHSAGRTIYACEVCQPLKYGKEEILEKTPGGDALLEARGGLLSSNENLDGTVTASPATSIPSLITKKPAKSMMRHRESRAVANTSMERHTCNNIYNGATFNNVPTWRLGEFSSRLAGLTQSRSDVCTLGTGALRNCANERFGLLRKTSSSPCSGQVVHQRNSLGAWQTFTNQHFPMRRVGYITLQALGTLRPQARIGLQAVSTLCLG